MDDDGSAPADNFCAEFDPAMREHDKIKNHWEYGELSALADALSHPRRVQIIRMLKKPESCVCLVRGPKSGPEFELIHHLEILKKSGLVSGEIDGDELKYRIHGPTFRHMKELFRCL